MSQNHSLNKEESTNCVGKHWLFTLTCKNQDPHHASYAVINSQSISHLNLRPEVIKSLEENLQETVCYIGISRDFLSKPKKQPLWKTVGSSQTPENKSAIQPSHPATENLCK